MTKGQFFLMAACNYLHFPPVSVASEGPETALQCCPHRLGYDSGGVSGVKNRANGKLDENSPQSIHIFLMSQSENCNLPNVKKFKRFE